MEIKFIYNNKEIKLEFNKNNNNKYKMSFFDFNLLNDICLFLFESILKNNMHINIDGNIFDVTPIKTKIQSFLYQIINGEIIKEQIETKLSLIILEILINNNILQNEQVEIRFFSQNKEAMNINIADVNYYITINNLSFETIFFKMITKDNILDISFKTNININYNIGDLLNITAMYCNKEITKQIQVLNFYYDELNQCYFISGKNVQ